MDDIPMRDTNGPHHHLHNDNEPILGRAAYDFPPPDGAESQKRVRKVAAGPTVPSYKGNTNRLRGQGENIHKYM
jgi:hypothetical protein